jgi:hypothetical protein
VSDIESTFVLHSRLKQALEDLRLAHEGSAQIDWFADSKAAPHLDSAAQGLFVALDRLEKEAIARYGEDDWRKLVPAPGPVDA